jgi:hypothetical protein
MGCSFQKLSTSSYSIASEYKSVNPNPDPSNYVILKSLELNGHLLLTVKYPDCVNFEGHKILLFQDLTLDQLKLQKTIDPHFSNNKKFHSPFARFEPTMWGWSVAETLMKTL